MDGGMDDGEESIKDTLLKYFWYYEAACKGTMWHVVVSYYKQMS